MEWLCVAGLLLAVAFGLVLAQQRALVKLSAEQENWPTNYEEGERR